MNTKHALIVGILAVIVSAIIGLEYLPQSGQRAEALTFQPMENVKTWSKDSSFILSNPIFYMQPSSVSNTGWVKIGIDITNNTPSIKNVNIDFKIDGIVVDFQDKDKTHVIQAGQTLTVTSTQYDLNLGLMTVVVSLLDADNYELLVQKSEIVRLDNTFKIISVAPNIWYDVQPAKIAYKLGNEIGKTNTEAGLIEMYTEYFDTTHQKQLNYIEIPLSKEGTPTGVAMIGIFKTEDADGNKPRMAKLFGKIDVSKITTDMKYYRFYSADMYTMERQDHIGILYEAPNEVGNYIQVYSSLSNEYSDVRDRERRSVGDDQDWMISNYGVDAAMRLGWEAYQILDCDDPDNNLQLYFCPSGTSTSGGQQA